MYHKKWEICSSFTCIGNGTCPVLHHFILFIFFISTIFVFAIGTAVIHVSTFSQTERAEQIFYGNEKTLEEMLIGIEKLFRCVKFQLKSFLHVFLHKSLLRTNRTFIRITNITSNHLTQQVAFIFVSSIRIWKFGNRMISVCVRFSE